MVGCRKERLEEPEERFIEEVLDEDEEEEREQKMRRVGEKKKSRTRVKKQMEVKARSSYTQSFSYRKLWAPSRNYSYKLKSGR